jgi:hypothetical protein
MIAGWLIAAACSFAGPASNGGEEVKMHTSTGTALDQWRATARLDREQITAKLGAPAVEINTYGKLSGLEAMHNESAHPGHFYFQGQALVLLYISGDAAEALDPSALRAALGDPELSVRSRAGKRFTHRVWASQGVAFSDDGDEVAFVEVFPATSTAQWQARYATDPPAFRK